MIRMDSLIHPHNYFVDIKEFDVSTITYNKPIGFYKVNRNMGIYYQKNPSMPKTKIIIRTPKMIVPFDVKEFGGENGKKTYKMCLSFSPLTNLYNEDEIKNFYKFVKEIDNANEETVLSYKKKWGLPKEMTYTKTLRRISKDYPHYMNINLPYDEHFKFLFKIYDENANPSNMETITKRSIVSVILELTDLRFGDDEFRANWTVMQIRKFKPYSNIQDFFMKNCFIRDPNELHFISKIEENRTESKPLLALPAPEKIQDKTQSVSLTFVPPSQTDLLNGIKNLRKTITIDKSINVGGKVIEEILPTIKKHKKKSKPEVPLEFDID
jgi:hypothetical protein